MINGLDCDHESPGRETENTSNTCVKFVCVFVDCFCIVTVSAALLFGRGSVGKVTTIPDAVLAVPSALMSLRLEPHSVPL
jgi:hypothetical protein